MYENGNIPFISSGDYNNGVVGYVMPKKDDVIDTGNCISISPVDGKALYQPADFLGQGGGGSSIILLYNDNINEYNGVFIATIITKLLKKHTFGDMANSKTIANELLLLPCKNNLPDFKYMEDYMKNLENKVSDKLNILSLLSNSFNYAY